MLIQNNEKRDGFKRRKFKTIYDFLAFEEVNVLA